MVVGVGPAPGGKGRGVSGAGGGVDCSAGAVVWGAEVSCAAAVNVTNRRVAIVHFQVRMTQILSVSLRNGVAQ